jgi:outer membrane protein assembly factor BamB
MLSVGGLAVLLAGCWPTPGAGPDRRSFNPLERTLVPAVVPRLTERFRAPLPEGTSPPVVSPAGLFVRGGTFLNAFEPGSGALRWSVQLPSEPSIGYTMRDPHILDADRVIVSIDTPRSGDYVQNVVVSVDTRTGADTALLETRGNLDSLRGDEVATIQAGDDVGLTTISVERLDSTSRWGGFAFDLAAGGGRASLGEDLLFVATGDRVQAYDPSVPCPDYSDEFQIPACTTLWARGVGGTSTPVVIGEDATVYAGSADGSLYALRSDTGGVRWFAPLGAAVDRPPALADDVLYGATADGRLSAVPTGGCGTLVCPVSWTTDPGAEVTVQPAVAGGVVYTGAADGTVRAFDAAGCGAPTCPPLWTADAGAPVTGGLAVYGGRLYVTTADALIGYALPA